MKKCEIDPDTVTREELAECILDVLEDTKDYMLTHNGYPRDLETIARAIVEKAKASPPAATGT